MSFASDLPESSPVLSRFNWVEIFIFMAAMLFALGMFLGRWQGLFPFVHLNGDGGNIASFVAGRTNPEAFPRDFMLNESSNFQFYYTIHFPVLSALESVTHDYGMAFMLLYPFHIVVHIIGFYWLGRVLFQNRFYAALLALLTALPLPVSFGEGWGLSVPDALPRLTFQALLPYVLALAILWSHQPRRWFWIMVMVGLLIWVHPVSAPVWGFAIWLGFWRVVPPDWLPIKRLGWMFALGLVFLVMVAPYAVHYSNYFQHGRTTANYERLLEIFSFRWGDGSVFVNLWLGFEAFIAISYRTLLLGVAGILVAFLLSRGEERKNAGMVVLWLTALLLVSVVLPIIDHTIAFSQKQIPLQYDLVRGIRYTLMIAWIFIFWMMWALNRYWRNRPYRFLVYGVMLVFSTSMIYQAVPLTPFWDFVGCLRQGQLVCPGPRSIDFADLIAYIRDNTEADAVMVGDDLAFRYGARRSLAYSFRDANILAYTNHDRLEEWYSIARESQTIAEIDALDQRTASLIDFAREVEGDYLVLDYETDSNILEIIVGQNAEIAYANAHFTLIRLNPINSST